MAQTPVKDARVNLTIPQIEAVDKLAAMHGVDRVTIIRAAIGEMVRAAGLTWEEMPKRGGYRPRRNS